MAKINVYNQMGQKTSSMTVADDLFGTKINPNLMTQAIRVYLSNQRMSVARTKVRNEVKVTKAKVWRQKGTGRARHGSRNAPIFVGGAKAHGPTGTQNYKLSLSKKMRQRSLFSALSSQLKEENILVVDKLDQLSQKTAKFDKFFNKLVKSPKKLLLLIDKQESSLKRPINNLPYLKSALSTGLNTYQVLNANKLIFTKTAIKALENHYLKKN